MRTGNFKLVWFISLLLALPVTKAIGQRDQSTTRAPRYYVISLGDPLGQPTAAAASINNIGWIAGDAYTTATTEHAELWLGVPIDLGTLGGPNSAVAWPNKNVRGQLVGIAETADTNRLGEYWSCALANFPTITGNTCYGFVWENGSMSPLRPFPGGLNSYGSSINNKGQAVGWAENGIHDSTCATPQVLQFEAAMWATKTGQMTELPPLPGDLDGAATAINDNGQVVGISGICDQAIGRYTARHAVIWNNGVPSNLGNFDGGVAWNTPTAVNIAGQVAGFENLPHTAPGSFNPVGFFWSNQNLEPIHPLEQDTNSMAWGMNDLGQVVGQSFGPGSARAFLYQNGVATDLNTLVQSDTSLYLLLANDINASGEIIGYATDTAINATVAFLAVPLTGAVNNGKQHQSAGKKSVVPDTLRQGLPPVGRFIEPR